MYAADKTDKVILAVLKKNARLSTREIAKKSGVPPATVYKRMKRMEAEGIIKGYAVMLDQEKLGKGVVAFILIKAKPGAEYEAMKKVIIPHEGVEDIATLAGEFDVIVKIRVGSMKELDNFVLETIRKMPDVMQTQTLIVFRS